MFGKIQSSQTGHHPYSDPSPCGECSLARYEIHYHIRATINMKAKI